MSRKNGRPDFSKYNAQPRVSLRKDIARFLAHARKNYPGVFVSYAEVVQRINGYSKPVNIKSKEVHSVRTSLTAVRRTLMDDHQCGLITDPALGVRATTDDADLLSSQGVKASTRLRSAQDGFSRTFALVDPSKIPNTAEYAALKTWHKTSILPVLKSISSTDFATKLLPPKRED